MTQQGGWSGEGQSGGQGLGAPQGQGPAGGAPGQGFGAPPPQPAPRQEPSSMAWMALILGGVSWMFGSLLTAIPGAIIAKMELDNINAGQSPEAGRVHCQIGFWASIIHIVLVLVSTVVVFCIFGGAILAFFGVAAASQGGGGL